MFILNYLKALTFVGISISSANAISAELCYCPEKPSGTECNNQCAGNPKGLVYIGKKGPKIDGPSPTIHPSQNPEDYQKKFENKFEMKKLQPATKGQ
jgi:hypothetical protein